MPSPVSITLNKPRLWPAIFCLAAFAGVSAPALAQSPPEDDLRAIAQTRLPVQALLNQGVKLTYGPAFNSLRQEAVDDQLQLFGGILGGRQKYDGVGRLELDGVSFLAGLGQRLTVDESPIDRFTYGFFGEGGAGGFEASRDYATGGRRKSDGDVNYFGAGFLLKTEFHNNFYMEASFRAGRAETALDTLETRDIRSQPLPAGLDSITAGYIGAAGGLGYLWPVDEAVSLDFYANMRWSHQSGETLTIDALTFKLDPIESTQFILGTRADFQAGPGLKIFTGLAWEHEFNGRQDIILSDGRHLAQPPDLEGDSFQGELGLELSPASLDGFTARLGLGGGWGDHESLTGALSLKYAF